MDGRIKGKPNTPTTESASGIWSVQEQYEAILSSIWPSLSVANDLYYVTYYQNLSTDVLTATQSFSSCNLGSASAATNKRVVIAVGYNQGGGAAAGVGISSATIAGTSATIIENLSTSGQERSAIIYADITGSTTTGTVSITYNSAFTSSLGSQGTIIGIYYIPDASAISSVTSGFSHRNNSLGTHSVTVNTNDGLVLASAAIGGSSSTSTLAWTNATEDYEYDPEPTRDDVYAGASMTSDGLTETISTSPDTEYGVLTVASFNQTTVEFLTSGSTWSVPSNVSTIKVECIGSGGGSLGGGGGGGGAYARTNSLSVTPGGTLYINVGGGTALGAGVDSWVNNTSATAPTSTSEGCLAKGGGDNTGTGGVGGSAASCIGDVTYSGGDGGDYSAPSRGGGGGAAGPNGAGAAGGDGVLNEDGGAGGGGADGGTAGSSTPASGGGAGGDSTTGTGGGGGSGLADGGTGTDGGGGGGSSGASSLSDAGAGGDGTSAFTQTSDGATAGPGGGGGAGSALANAGAAGGNYGGGRGGGGTSGGTFYGGAGLIVITY